ncbi:dynamin family protein [Candidatus Clostridium helianthi]|uniref:Dynamin family protein n=1 Tax=Candidatus Clostridium helianthi TaxID=3381660 RepID=A0ABW8SB05_9CLOT
MTNLYIKYNPYKVETEFIINNSPVSPNSTLATQSKKRLQYWLEKNNNNWNGIVEELRKVTNDNELKIVFEGRKIDFEDLKLTIDKNKKSLKITLKHVEVKDDKDILKEIDELINIFDNGPIEELKSKEIKKAYNEVKSSKFRINVIATMSSGKSTLINSLIGYELLPSKNEACTATIARITADDRYKEFTAECRDENERIVYKRKKVSIEDIEKYNEDEKVTYIDIEGCLPNISSEKMNLLLMDTPGPNNARNADHGELTESIIEDKNKGIVLYVINATQFGINDDSILLQMIANQMKRGGKQSKDRFIFAINKCDEFDCEKNESIPSLLKSVTEYLANYGIDEPNLFPVSAQTAKLIRMQQRGIELTRKEKKDLSVYEDFIEIPGFHFEKMASLSESCRMKIEYKLNMAVKEGNEYEEALIHTGIPAIEEAINEYLDKYAYPIKINDAIGEFQTIAEEDIMKNNLDKELASDSNAYNKIRLQIEDAKKKIANGERVNLIKSKIDRFNIDESRFKEVEKKLVLSFDQLTRKYEGKDKIEKSLAQNHINVFKNETNKLQKNFELSLDITIKNSVIDQGERLINEYESYLKELQNDIRIEGFNFSKVRTIQKIKIDNVDDLIAKYEETENIYEERRYKNENKKWYKFWTWFEDSYYTVNEKVGEIEYINISSLVKEYMAKLSNQTQYNIDSAKDKSKEDINRLKEYFKSELNKLDKVMINTLAELDRNTRDEAEIKERVEKNKKTKIWLEDVIQRINNITSISL